MTADARAGRPATLIESLGVYLPPREVSTEAVLRGCVRPNRFPLERMSGIKTRRVAGDTEFGIDLARRAIERCLATSRHPPSDVEMVISASVGHCDGPGLWISHEPSTAIRLAERFGFDRAIAFDVASACSGMFTAIAIVDALIRQRAIRCALVVSGEYISHLGATAQKEIEGLLDPRLACLTLGDAGAAVMLEATDLPGRGFDALDLTTFGAYARHCVAMPTRQAHGGAIMFTEAMQLSDAATRHGAAHALATIRRAGWAVDGFEHLIMHQTSGTALAGAVREINRLVKAPVCHDGNTINNLAHRGNTASTSHFVALADNIANGRIRSGDRTIFAISGSGLTVGTGLYRFDDLPDRLLAPAGPGAPGREPERPEIGAAGAEPARIRIESVGTASPGEAATADTLTLLRLAATDALGRSSHRAEDLALLIFAGVYRTDVVSEPAIAALLAGELGIPSLWAFDVFNGAVGFLDACHVAAGLLRARSGTTAMVVAAEVENNAEFFPADRLGIEPAGSALILDGDTVGTGFGRFHFRSFTEHLNAFTSGCRNRDGKPYLDFRRRADLMDRYLDGIAETVTGQLAVEGLELERIARIFPPQISPAFTLQLSDRLGLPLDRFVTALPGDRDLYSSGLPFAFRRALDRGLVRAGDFGLVIAAGSGVQVGCAIYHF